MKSPAAKSAAILALAISFLLGVLMGITFNRPLSHLIPKRPDYQRDSPDARVVEIRERLVDQLELTVDQRPVVDAAVEKMVTTIQEAQRGFHPTITRAIVDAIDTMLPALNETQREILENRRQNILRNQYRPSGPPPSGAGPGMGPPNGRGFGPPPNGGFGGPPNGGGIGVGGPRNAGGPPERP